jgi:hypothetical protein
LKDPYFELRDAENSNENDVNYEQLFDLRQTIRYMPINKQFQEDVYVPKAQKKDAVIGKNTSLFKFKDEQECVSQSKSAKYYMKKSEIIDIIKKNSNYTKLMPKKYLSLSKKDLCKEVASQILKN